MKIMTAHMKKLIGLVLSALLLSSVALPQQVVRRPIWTPASATAVVGHSLLYTGNGSAGHAITSAEFSPDLTIIRRRGGAIGTQWYWVDNVRGATLEIYSSTNGAEGTNANGLTSFDANGFTVGSSGNYNANAVDFLALVLQEVSGAFDIVGYAGTGSAHTVSHGLGVTPELMIVKNRGPFGRNWIVYPGPLSSPATKFLNLDATGAVSTSSTVWNNTAPTSSVFTVGTATQTNESGSNFVAYLFASLNPGVKVGSYTGDGNTNGPAITAPGFRPRFVIIKRTDNTGDWYIFEDQADSSSPHNKYNKLNAGGATAETTTTNTAGGLDFLSDGFQSIDAAAADINVNGATYIYLAIA